MSLADIQKFFIERWDFLVAIALVVGATGILGSLWKWHKTRQQQQRQRQIPSGDFPFEVILPHSPAVVKHLMPAQGVNDTDPLADYNIPYLDRQPGKSVRRELELAFDEQPWVIILGRTGLGKTREAAHLAELLNSAGWTVLKLKEQAGEWLDELRQFPTDKISPNDKLLFFLDDLNPWFCRGNFREIHKEAEDTSQPLRVPVQERLSRTLEFFERECRAEVRVIATARNETVIAENDPTQTSELAKLQFERYPKFWQRFYRYELTPPEDDTITRLLTDRVPVAQVQAKTADFDKIAQRNDGTFRNIIENLRTARNRGIVLSAETLPETLDRTWRKRYKDAIKRYPTAVHVYDAIALLRTLNLSLHPALVEATARLFISQKRLGWFWQAWQTRQALHYLIHAEQILSPRDGQIETRQKPVDVHHYADSVLILLGKLGRVYTTQQLAQEFLRCGNALYALGRYEEAIIAYDHVIAIKLDFYYVFAFKGLALLALGRYEEAISAFDHEIALQPDDPEVFTIKGITLRDLGRYQEAIIAYDHAIALQPNDPDPFAFKGIALSYLGRYEEAIIAYDHAIALQPDYPQAFYNKGLALLALGRYKEAISTYDHAISLQPDNPKAFYDKGLALLALGRYKEAISTYDHAIALQPDDPKVFAIKGTTLRILGRYEEAISAFDQEIVIKSDDPEGFYHKACCYAGWGKLEEAIETLQRAIKLNPEYREMAKMDADFDGIRQDARFQALVEE